MITDCAWFISNLVAFGAYAKSKVGVVLTGQFLVPSTRFLDDCFFEKQVHGGYATSIFTYAAVAVFEFVPDASCPRVLVVPCFDAAADTCHLWLV